MKFLKKILVVVSLLTTVLAFILMMDFFPKVSVSSQEQIRPDEEEQVKISVQRFTEIVEKNKDKGLVGRGAHAKGHACVKAYFDVLPDINKKFQYGIFAVPGKQFKSWIRFSNANSAFSNLHDKEKDAHGMAIKLLNVEQLSLEGNHYQDFLMVDNPNFFSPDIASYNQFLNSQSVFAFFFPGLNPFDWRIREFFVALDTLKKPLVSPLHMHFFSNTAYKLGINNIKFSARSCERIETDIDLNDDAKDFLRETMKTELEQRSVCFQFMVQLQNIEKKMPVEDPSILWSEKDSPFLSVAKITIPKQEFDSEEHVKFCENIAFSPWNALPEHRPLGQFNRIRKHVYTSSSNYRHKQNSLSEPVDLDW